MPGVKFSNFIVALVKYLCCVVTRYVVKPRYYEHIYSETVKINNFEIPGIQAKQQQTTQLHLGLLFSQRKKSLPWVGCGPTTLCSLGERSQNVTVQ